MIAERKYIRFLIEDRFNYIAKDKSGHIFLYSSRPKKDLKTGMWNHGGRSLGLSYLMHLLGDGDSITLTGSKITEDQIYAFFSDLSCDDSEARRLEDYLR